jgi:type VI protein secretion system component VasF
VIWVVVGVVVFWLAGVLVGVSLRLARWGDEAMEQAPRPVRQPGVLD